jgi:hypothetical protein
MFLFQFDAFFVFYLTKKTSFGDFSYDSNSANSE